MKKRMFNNKYGLTEAVLQRRKTMTRDIFDYETYRKLWEDMCRLGTPCFDTFDDFLVKRKARYKIGEVVAVAQCYEDAILDVGEEKWNKIHKWYNINYLCHEKGLHNKMFVRADLMPHQFKITDIKAERLQDISDEDCLKEGIMWDYVDYPIMSRKVYFFNDYESFRSPRLAFASLVNRIFGKSTWEFNPWVYAYSFELVK